MNPRIVACLVLACGNSACAGDESRHAASAPTVRIQPPSNGAGPDATPPPGHSGPSSALTLEECVAWVRTGRDLDDGPNARAYRAALVMEEEGQLTDAFDAYRDLAENHAGTPVGQRAMLAMAEIYERQGGTPDAMDTLAEALRITPRSSPTHLLALYRLAELRAMVDQDEERLARLRALVAEARRGPRHECAHPILLAARGSLIATYARAGRLESAFEFFHGALEEPDGEWAETKVAIAELAGRLVEDGRETDAIDLLTSVIASDAVPEVCDAVTAVVETLAASKALPPPDIEQLFTLHRARCGAR